MYTSHVIAKGELTLYHAILSFNDFETELIKTLLEKEKMLVTTMFFSQSKTEIKILAELKLSSANAFNLVKAKILLFGNE